MTTEDFKILYQFNAWANARTLQSLESVAEDQLYVDLKNSFGSIYGTLLHLCGAEDIWLQRLQGADPGIFMKKENYKTVEEIRVRWGEVEKGWNTYISQLTESELQRNLVFHNMKGEEVTQKVWHSLQHLVNHSTYHRGQITTLVRQVGGIPQSTDLIIYYRQKQ
jgi:uncharacterized damage-inducible protein DinB